MLDWLVCTLQPVLRLLYWGLAVPAILLLLVFTFLSLSVHHNSGALLADPNHTHPPPDTLSTTLRDHDAHANLPCYAPAPIFMATVITRNETHDCNTNICMCSVPPEAPRKDWPWYVSLACVAFCVRT